MKEDISLREILSSTYLSSGRWYRFLELRKNKKTTKATYRCVLFDFVQNTFAVYPQRSRSTACVCLRIRPARRSQTGALLKRNTIVRLAHIAFVQVKAFEQLPIRYANWLDVFVKIQRLIEFNYSNIVIELFLVVFRMHVKPADGVHL